MWRYMEPYTIQHSIAQNERIIGERIRQQFFMIIIIIHNTHNNIKSTFFCPFHFILRFPRCDKKNCFLMYKYINSSRSAKKRKKTEGILNNSTVVVRNPLRASYYWFSSISFRFSLAWCASSSHRHCWCWQCTYTSVSVTIYMQTMRHAHHTTTKGCV
jgi:hypothetical protein